jgi:hypothetical protein
MKKTVIVTLLLLAVDLFRVHVVAQQETAVAVPPEEDFMRIVREEYYPENPVAGENGRVAIRLRDTFTYDDKSFWEWRNAPERELNPAKHVEIVNALAAFGRKGFGTEAVETILKLMEDRILDLNQSDEKTFSGAVRHAFLEAIPYKYSIPTLLTAYDKAPESGKSQPLLLLCLIIGDTNALRDYHKQVIPFFLELLQPKMKDRYTGIHLRQLASAYFNLAEFSSEVHIALEKKAFGKDDSLESRIVAIDALLAFCPPRERDGVIEKYLPQMFGPLLSDDLDDQKLFGECIIRSARDGHAISQLKRGVPRGPDMEYANPFEWCKSNTSFFVDDRVFRLVFLSLFSIDPTGEATAAFLKGAAAKRNLPDDFAAIVQDIKQNEVLGYLFVDPNTRGRPRKPQERTERLRQRLADAPEILKVIDDLVAAVGR